MMLELDPCAAPYSVYRLYGPEDRLLYVGSSANPEARMREHRSRVWWNDVKRAAVEGFPTRREALMAETRAITTEMPVFNERRSIESDPVRTYRLSDELYRAAREAEMRLAFERKARPDLGRHVKLALEAFVVDPAAFQAACRRIIGEEA